MIDDNTKETMKQHQRKMVWLDAEKTKFGTAQENYSSKVSSPPITKKSQEDAGTPV